MKKLFCLLAFSLYLHSASAQHEAKLILKENNLENAYPRLSNDNSKILYQSNRTGKWQLFVLNITSRSQQRITNNTFNDNFPDWSPDNKWIAFVSDRDGNEEIYLMKADGTDPKRITSSSSRDIHPYFSPDGQYILFNSDRGNGSFDIYRYTIASAKTERLTNTPEDETCARYSPDMKRIVFLKNSNVSDDLFVMNTGNLQLKNITNTPSYNHGWPVFSPDGKWVYYSSMEKGSYSIYRVHPDGSGKEQITNAGNGEEDARVYISKDNKLMIFNKKTGRTIAIYSEKIS